MLLNGIFILVRGCKNDGKEGEAGRCISGSDGKLCFSEDGRGKVWKDYMEGIINEENDWMTVWKEINSSEDLVRLCGNCSLICRYKTKSKDI